tara:strand:+ start:17409 stop:17783 length:375 start_codon:yes stop_codon:yes gene_type:complete
MAQTEKYNLARRLVDLTMKDSYPGRRRDKASEGTSEVKQRSNDKFMRLWADIYAKHYSDEQLTALVEFYGSDIGISIVNAKPTLTAEFESRISELNTSSFTPAHGDTKSSSFGIRSVTRKDEDS